MGAATAADDLGWAARAAPPQTSIESAAVAASVLVNIRVLRALSAVLALQAKPATAPVVHSLALRMAGNSPGAEPVSPRPVAPPTFAKDPPP